MTTGRIMGTMGIMVMGIRTSTILFTRLTMAGVQVAGDLASALIGEVPIIMVTTGTPTTDILITDMVTMATPITDMGTRGIIQAIASTTGMSLITTAEDLP